MNEIIIEPNKSLKRFWRELWAYRDLFYFLAWRDVLVRYKQTTIGIAWSVVRPLLTAVVFTLVFSRIAKLPSGNVPYPILIYAAMLPWQFFSNSIQQSAESLIQDANLISKVYFPRLIIPSTAIAVSLIDFFISLVILFALMIWYGYLPDGKIIFLPLLLLWLTMVSLGGGFLLAALNVKYRDFRYIVPFIVQFGLYICPVGFSSDLVPEKFRFIYSLNPMVGIIDGFRWVLLGKNVNLYWPGFLLSLLITVILFISGVIYFLKTERKFADVI